MYCSHPVINPIAFLEIVSTQEFVFIDPFTPSSTSRQRSNAFCRVKFKSSILRAHAPMVRHFALSSERAEIALASSIV